MLQPLQIPAAALEPHEGTKSLEDLYALPAGSTVFARLTPRGLFERAELDSVQPNAVTATVTAFNSGARHHVPIHHITQSVVLQDASHEASSEELGSSDNDVGDEGDDMGESDSQDEDSAPLGPTALAVFDADSAACCSISALLCLGPLECCTASCLH